MNTSQPTPARDIRPLNIILLHLLPGVGKRKVLDLVNESAFLLNEPVDRNFWLYLEKTLRRSIPQRERQSLGRAVELVLSRLATGEFGLVHLFEEAYPAALKQIYDPPLLLFYKGDARLLGMDSVAMVGARRASDYGVSTAQELALRLGQAGLVVVSGMALGIDSAAHIGVLKGEGRTVAVLGSGVDVVYPKQAAGLYRTICERGCVASEFPPGIYPAPQNFPLRNRVISGIALGVVIVEATHRSGSLITARLALEHGRELFAVPGPVHSLFSVGPNYLIKQGAKLVQVWQDVVEELPAEVKSRLRWQPCLSMDDTLKTLPLAGSVEKLSLTTEAEKVYKKLFFDRKVHLETLLEQTELKLGALGDALLTLQLDGLIQELPGQFYVRNMR